MGHVVIATWIAKEGNADRIQEILAEMSPTNRAEPKVLDFQAHVSAEDPNKFVLYEHYTDVSGYEDHRETEPFQRLVIGEAITLLADRRLEQFSTFAEPVS